MRGFRSVCGRRSGRWRSSIDPVRPMPPAAERADVRWSDRSLGVGRGRGQAGAGEAVDGGARPARAGCPAARFELLRPQAAPTDHIQVNLSRPSRAVKHLWSLLRPRGSSAWIWATGSMGVVADRVPDGAVAARADAPAVSSGAGENGHAAAAWGELVDTLVVRFGAGQRAFASSRWNRICRNGRFANGRRWSRLPRSAGGGHSRGPAHRALCTPGARGCDGAHADGPILSVGWRGRRWNIVSCRTRTARAGMVAMGPAPHATDERDREPRRRRRSRRRRPGLLRRADRGGRWLWMCRHLGTSRWFVHGEWN